MLAITSRDLVAAEAHYHRSCYKDYTRDESSRAKVHEKSEDDIYQEKENEAFSMLFKHIRSHLFDHPHIKTMVSLTDTLVKNMQSQSSNKEAQSPSRNLERALRFSQMTKENFWLYHPHYLKKCW